MKVAVLGLGAMGSRIARRLLDAGNDVVVWNRTPTKAEGFPRVAASAAEAAEEADVTITMLANPEALRDVTEQIEPRLLIEMSTVGPEAVAELARRMEVIDAPVLGSRSEAEEGTLQIFVGATPEQYAQWSPLLAPLGTTHHVGPVGAGASAKLVANSTLLGTIGVLGEALVLARRLGLSREAAFEVLAVSPLAAQAERRRPGVEANDYPPRFGLALARKDADLVGAAAPDLRVAQAVRSWLAEADDAGWGDRDYSAVLGWLLDVADEQQNQRDNKNDEKPVVDGKSADQRENDQQQDQHP
ncbi:MAG: NAD(P)-dependent oxidoreductase [Gaiellaceae bacterium]|jgi:3-hydroxyisobutyrate dehydrogenase-like beta-hydroxyacid dehydrogenase